MGEPLLRVQNLSVSLQTSAGRVPVIHDLSLEITSGELVGIAGESGSGKSMTALALLNILPPGAVASGSIRFDGRELAGLDERGWQHVRGTNIALVFQDSSAALHPMLPVGRQITEHMRTGLGISSKAANARAAELLEQVRIPEPGRAMRSYPHQFSGGMRQRIAIAVALAGRPRVLIADEPTTALDVTIQAGILSLLSDLCREEDLAVLFITHDLGVMSALTRRIYMLYAGRVMESGATGKVLTAPAHPYTAALLAARPHGLGAKGTLRAIPGATVVPGQAPPGCPFAPRCTFAVPACEQGVPRLDNIGNGRTLACIVAPDLSEVHR